MVRLSNTVIGILNALTFLLSVPILAGGIWLRARADGTECERYLAAPVIAFGVLLMLVSVAGLVGACCRVTCLLWFYLVAMFVVIVVLLGLTIFAFVVTNKGAGDAVSDRGIREYRLGDYSNWLQKRVENNKNWNRIRGCLADSKVCRSLDNKQDTLTKFLQNDVSPIQSGCCKPPASCGFTFSNNQWTGTANSTSEPDCAAWGNDASKLCYDCQTCKAGVLATLRRDWKRIAILNIIFLVFIIIVYSVGCCAFRNNRRDHHNGGYRQGAYA